MTNAELREIAYKLKDRRDRNMRALDRDEVNGTISEPSYREAIKKVYASHNGYVKAVENAIWFDSACGMSTYQFEQMAGYNNSYGVA